MDLRWQWRLANGGRVAAVIERARELEIVTQGDRVLSSAPRGAQPDGHRVLVDAEREPGASDRPPIEAVVTFAAHAPVCILRVDDQEVAPLAWPMREKRPEPSPRPKLGFLYPVAVLAVLASVGVLVRALRSDHAPAAVASKLAGTYRAPNGLFVAHYPDDFDAKVALLPAGVGGVVLEEKAKTAAILIAAVPHGSALHDPWALQQRLHAEALANMPSGDGSYAETARREGTCVGRPGAIVAGRIVRWGKPTARIWTCAFANERAGYFAMTLLMEPVADDVERGARVVVEGTELTNLSDLAAASASPLPSILLPAPP